MPVLPKPELLEIYQEFMKGNLMNVLEPSIEIATVKDRFSDYALISLGEAIIESE